MQRSAAVKVVLLDVDVEDRASRLDPLDLRPNVPGERYLVVSSVQTRRSSLSAPLTSNEPSRNASTLNPSIL